MSTGEIRASTGDGTSTGDPPRIGLALSGGGFRAVAYGLGCLRALHRLGVLPSVRVVSGVSGGSLLAAMWVYGPPEFHEFDSTVVAMLSTNLQRELVRRTIAPPSVLRSFSGLAVSATTGRPLRHNRTESLVAALLAHEFGRRTMSEVTHPVATILSSTDLASGNAVRFGSEASACSVYGEITNSVTVAEAVAASAAFPVLLPALCRDFQFRTTTGAVTEKTLLLTDGGVYDNLGLSPLWPGRSADHTRHVYDGLSHLVVVDAGQGRHMGTAPRFWVGRIKRAFEITHTKNQDAARARLHQTVSSRQLTGFVHAYLGMADERLPVAVPNLVGREQVRHYATDFKAMPAADLHAITARGEQLTDALMSHHCPSLRASR